MLSGIYQWVLNIAVCLIFMSLILKLLPEKTYAKYVRYFMGMVLLLVVLEPVGNLFHLDEVMEELEQGFESSAREDRFREELALMGEEYEEEMIRQYEDELSRGAAEALSRQGFGEVAVSVEIDGDPESGTFGQILRAAASGEPSGEEGEIAVERKKVQILDEDASYREQAENGELRSALASYLGIGEEQVSVR